MPKPKYLYWLTNRGGFKSAFQFNEAAGNVISPNSSCIFNMNFNGLPSAPAYKLKLEQFSINNTAQGNVFDLPNATPLVVGTQCATGLVEFEGFNPVAGSVYATSSTAMAGGAAPAAQMGADVPARPRCILTRFDTSFMSTADRADCSVAPPMTPEVLVHRPQNGEYTFWIRGILNPDGILVIDNGAGNRRQDIGDWLACISLTPMSNEEMNEYYNIQSN